MFTLQLRRKIVLVLLVIWIASTYQVSATLATTSTQSILYDQTDSPGGDFSSQKFEVALADFDSQGADDFIIPASDGSWTIARVEVLGSYSEGGGPSPLVNTYFYADAGGLPGATVYSATGVVPANDVAGDLSIDLPSPVVLSAGTYWLSVQADMDFTPNGSWFWTNRTVQSNNPYVWQNPGGGFDSGCPTWAPGETICGLGGPDTLFRLLGSTSPPAATPTPTYTSPPYIYLPVVTNNSSASNPPPHTPTPIPTPTKLYLRNGSVLSEIPPTSLTQVYIYPGTVREWQIPLTGDISGTDYEFSLLLASTSSTSFSVTLLVSGTMGAQTLGSAIFTATSSTYRRFTANVTGPDPATTSGDTLILRIQHISGGMGAVLVGPLTYGQDSFVTIPGQQQSTTPIPTNTPTASPTATHTPTPTNTPTPSSLDPADLPCLYAVNWWRNDSWPYNLIHSTYSPSCLMPEAPVVFVPIYGSQGQWIGYQATIKRLGKPSFDMNVSYIFNNFGGVTGANVTKTYEGGLGQHQMTITKFCPTIGQLTGYKVKISAPPYDGQEVTIGICL